MALGLDPELVARQRALAADSWAHLQVHGGQGGAPASRMRGAGGGHRLDHEENADAPSRKEQPIMMPTSPRAAVARLEHSASLDRPAEALERLARTIHSAPHARAPLQGGGVGPPWPAALSDVPVGAWLSSLVVDVTHPRGAAASTTLLRLALLSSVPTAALGLADYLRLEQDQRRVATVHVAANGVALTLGAASLRARRAGHHLRGVVLSAAGAAVLGAGGFLGGHLAARLGPPVPEDSHAAGRPLGALLTTQEEEALAADAATPTGPASDGRRP